MSCQDILNKYATNGLMMKCLKSRNVMNFVPGLIVFKDVAQKQLYDRQYYQCCMCRMCCA